MSTLGPDRGTLFSSNCVEKYFSVLSPFSPAALERHHLFILSHFLLKPQMNLISFLLQQEMSLNLLRSGRLLSTGVQPVKVSVFPTQLTSLFVKKRGFCPHVLHLRIIFLSSFTCSAFSHHSLAVL